MEEIIKDMSKKLQEKDKIIAQTVKQATLTDTLKALKKKQLLTDTVRPKPIQTTNIVNFSKIESSFSPKATLHYDDLN